MKFHKLSENKLKIIITSEELPDYSNFDDFISDSNEARNSFLDILEKACSEVGFITKNYKIKIDAAVLNNGNLVFTITKLVKLKQSKAVVVTPRKIPKDEYSAQDSNCVIYKFECFDDFCNFCFHLKKLDIHNIHSFAKSIELYLYNNSYYLYISNVNDTHKEKGRFYSSITEFSKFFSSKDVFSHVLREKGSLVIKNNAITNYIKKIKK